MTFINFPRKLLTHECQLKTADVEEGKTPKQMQRPFLMCLYKKMIYQRQLVTRCNNYERA